MTEEALDTHSLVTPEAQPPGPRRRCSVCRQPGHRFDKCPERPAGATKPPRASARATTRLGRDLEEALGSGRSYVEEGVEERGLRRVERTRAEVAARLPPRTTPLEDTTPLTMLLDDWTKRFELTPTERETLFCVATNAMSLRELSLHRRDATVLETYLQADNAARKTGHKAIGGAAMTLLREALAFSTFDWEKRERIREERDSEPEDDE